MKALKGTRTHDNLKAAFAGESQANRRYLYFAAKADVEGQNDVSALFRSTAEGEFQPCSARPPRARPGTRTGTWSISRRWATRRPTCRSGARART